MISAGHKPHVQRVQIIAACASMAGCDPIVNIAGANFPAWLLCAILGMLLAAAMRPLFVALKVEPFMGPLPVIYGCLALLLGCTIWLLLFNRV